MKILSILSDRKVFVEGSAVRARLLEYGGLVDELHVIVFAKKSLGFKDEIISPNIFLYPSNSVGKFFHIPATIIRAYALKRRGVSVDVVTTQDPFEAGFVGFIVAGILGARLHLQVHTDFMSPYFADESVLNRLRVLVAKFLIPRANAIRVVSERIKKSLQPIVKSSTPIAVLPIFVDSVQTVSVEKKFPQFEKIILVASRLSREKNIGNVIEAMKQIVAKHPRAGLVIVGSGEEEARLKKLVAQLGLDKNVVFEGWQDNLTSYYKVADVFVLSSYYEGYGMVVVEALAAGCPVIMTDVGCAEEVVHDGENGLIVPVGDTLALAHAIERVVSGEVKLVAKTPKLPTKEEYLSAYKKSWEDATNERLTE